MNDIKDLPDVDLGPIKDDLVPEDEPQDKDPAEAVATDLAQFKTPEALLKSYKELQATFTKTSQANKALEGKINELQNQIALSRVPIQAPQNPGFDQQYLDNPQKAISDQILTMRVSEILEDEQTSNPEEFQERYDYAKRVISQYPMLGRSPGGVKRAFKAGDELRAKTLKQSTNKALSALLGENITEDDIKSLRALLKQKPNSNAYMPDTDTSTNRTQNLTLKPETAKNIEDAVNKGDVDGVLSNMFSVLAE